MTAEHHGSDGDLLVETGIPLQESMAQLREQACRVFTYGTSDDLGTEATAIFHAVDQSSRQVTRLDVRVTCSPSHADGSRDAYGFSRLATFALSGAGTGHEYSLWYCDKDELPGEAKTFYDLRAADIDSPWSDGMVQYLIRMMARGGE